MPISKAKVLGICLVLTLTASFAQAFPADASAPSGEEIKTK